MMGGEELEGCWKKGNKTQTDRNERSQCTQHTGAIIDHRNMLQPENLESRS